MDNGDIISRLPRDLLISILSHLKFKEAVATGVLSHLWEKLWTFYHGDLDFEVSKMFQQNGCSNYIRLLDKVLDTLELVESGGVLDSFVLRSMCPDHLRSGDRWVQFALEKRSVRRLSFENNFFFLRSGCKLHSPGYDFPLLRYSNSQQWKVRSLMSLSFKRVNVSGEVIEHFISNCPLLQSLDLIESRKPLIRLRISGETLALRRLCIIRCPDLTDIELYAPNLVSLCYHNSKTTAIFDIRNVPKLEELSIGIWSICPRASVLALRLLYCFSYIQKLELDIHRIYMEEPINFTALPEVTSVKYLTMRFIGFCCRSILAWTPLVKAFPDLQKFTLRMIARVDGNIDGVAGWQETFPHKHLKALEIYGFGKSHDDIELVTRFVKNMATIEKIVIFCDGCGDGLVVFKPRVEEAVRLSMELKQMIPEKVNLAIHTP